MGKQSTKELAKQNKDLSTNVLFDQEYTGFENVTQNCLSVPFIKLAQSISNEVLEDTPAYIKGLKPGYFFNTMTKKIYGKTLKFIPLGQIHTYIKWGKTKGSIEKIYSESEYVNLSDDEKNEKDENDKNKIMESFNLFLLLPDSIDDGIIIFLFASTKIKYYKKFLTALFNTKSPTGKKIPMFASIWEATSVINKNDAGTWYNVGDKSSSTINFIEYTPDEFVKPVLAAIDLVQIYINREKEIDYGTIKEETPIEESSF
jgi:hypothetical protein